MKFTNLLTGYIPGSVVMRHGIALVFWIRRSGTVGGTAHTAYSYGSILPSGIWTDLTISPIFPLSNLESHSFTVMVESGRDKGCALRYRVRPPGKREDIQRFDRLWVCVAVEMMDVLQRGGRPALRTGNSYAQVRNFGSPWSPAC